MTTYKTVKIPLWAYENAKLAKGDILTGRLHIDGQLILNPVMCPRCHSRIFLHDNIGRCESCMYSQQGYFPQFGIGVILGLGLAVLYNENVDSRNLRMINEEISAVRRKKKVKK